METLPFCAQLILLLATDLLALLEAPLTSVRRSRMTGCQDHSAQLQILSVWVGALLAQPISLSYN